MCASGAGRSTPHGDGFFASFDGPARAIRCAHAILESVRELGLDVRVGLHTGECEVAGAAKSPASRSTPAHASRHLANPGEVLVSSTVRTLSPGLGIQFQDRGTHELKGVGRWHLYAPLAGT